MLKINTQLEDGKAYVSLEGELNTVTAKDFRSEVEGFIDEVTDFTIDMKDLVYITSAGLRVLLYIEQTMEEQGELRVLNVCEDVMDVFEVSGFTEVLNIE